MLLLVFLGGVLTILSPCILPVIPLVFARTGRRLWSESAPMLLGLAIAFTVTALIATTAVRWLLVANEIGRWAALLLLAAVGVALLSPRVAELAARPATGWANLMIGAPSDSSVRLSTTRNALVGMAIGVLWAPCAGPILGLVIAAAAVSPPARAASLFFAFALGAVMSLAAVLSIGTRLVNRVRRAGAADVIVRRVLGVATLATVVALASGWDRELFARGGVVNTASAEELLVSRLGPNARPAAGATDAGTSLDDFAASERAIAAARHATIRLAASDGTMPSFAGATEWINGAPLTPDSLRGKVVLVDFWTFACYNCLNALPHVKALYAKYRDRGFVVVGVHTPELAHERLLPNVRREVARLGITYPVVVDNDWRIWNAYHNRYWPAAYFVDATGSLRFHQFGEGRYEEQDRVVAKLLAERDAAIASK
jgi:cytochrome c biogenesis protein CcdA/thiol-disulfide isomerase/thioredoxin